MVVIPTLAAGEELRACLNSLQHQTWKNFQTVVVDNSGRGVVRALNMSQFGAEVLESPCNLGFGGAVNSAYCKTRPQFLATLNDDATACPRWLESLLAAMQSEQRVGMCASRVLLAGENRLDSAGMLMSRDGSSKQRGHGEAPDRFNVEDEALLPSGSAALYRGAMLEETGLFDESFFLYCEDTDLGLRARWAGWRCRYVPEAIVSHHYSHSAGRSSPLKAFYVERNRLFLATKNLPLADLLTAPFYSVARYFWHTRYMADGRGKAAEFRSMGNSAWRLAWYVLRAHLALVPAMPRLVRQRRLIRKRARLSSREFRELLRAHSISMRQVGAL